MPEPRPLLHDLQASTPEVRLGLSRAGVQGAEKAIRLRWGGAEKLISAEIDCSVDLDPRQKGVHMSRFPEVFEEAIDEVVLEEAFLVEELAEHIARRIVARQSAGRAEVRITARYPLARRTPVTGLATQALIALVGIALQSVLERYAELGDADFLLARQLNFETIHSHDVVAERHGTVGELRRELQSGEPAPRHTELREWLSGAPETKAALGS